MQINSFTGLILNSSIRLSSPVVDEALNHKEVYYLDLLREIFDELNFYYQQSKKGFASADKRLNGTLIALSKTLCRMSPNISDIFFDSITEEIECKWFIISSLIGFDHVEPGYYEDKLLETIQHKNLLPKPFTRALKLSKANTLSKQLERLFVYSTPAIKLELLEILDYRGELDKTWLKSILNKAEPMLKHKINQLLNKI